jgi:1-phosphatidylinositol-3-phosphate 5-kinase
MENLTLGMNAKNISKYDLKGSMSRRYVVTTNKNVTKLDTNFLEDNNSKPVCMNYTLHRLMEIAIHNDTSFLSRHEKIDYSFLVWIDHDLKLIRVGIIDYIQYYSLAKQLEHQVKKALNSGKNPTILDPVPYKQRFKMAINKYFMSILEDKPIEEFSVLVQKQIKMK